MDALGYAYYYSSIIYQMDITVDAGKTLKKHHARPEIRVAFRLIPQHY